MTTPRGAHDLSWCRSGNCLIAKKQISRGLRTDAYFSFEAAVGGSRPTPQSLITFATYGKPKSLGSGFTALADKFNCTSRNAARLRWVEELGYPCSSPDPTRSQSP